MSQSDIDVPDVGWVSDSVIQQINSEQIPLSWEYVEIGELCGLINGRAFKPSEWKDNGLPIIRIQNLNNNAASFNYFDGVIDEKHRIKEGDLLFAWSGTPGTSFGAHVWKGKESVLNQHIFKVTFKQNRIDRDFLRYAINQKLDELISGAHGGVGLRHVTKGKFEKTKISFPPFAEQQQIAAKLDELLAQVDILKTRLDAIPKILKRFRQSVLAAAVSGKLTEDWRNDEQYTKNEFGWHIPSKWQLLLIDDIAEVKGGKRLPKGEILVSENTGFPYIRAGQLKGGTVTEDDQLFLLKHVQEKISRYIVNTGDLYITIVGACIGDAGIIPSNYDGANLTENAAKLCLFKKPLKKQFLSSWLRSQYLQDIIQHEIKSGAQGKLALKRIKTLPFPYPTIEEQTEIVRRVEQIFTYADQIEQRVKDAQARVNHLTQAILGKAFRGELTAEWREQNPDLTTGENSAEALLARIKEERHNLEHNKVTKRRIIKKSGENMKPKGIVPIIEALKAAGQPLSSQDLLVQSGYPGDAGTEQLEAFFLDIREQLNAKAITRNRQGDKEFFAIAE